MDENYEGKLQRYYGCNKAIKTHIKDKKKFSNEIKNGDRKEKKMEENNEQGKHFQMKNCDCLKFDSY